MKCGGKENMQLFEYIDVLKQPYDIFYTDSVHSPLHWHYYSEILYMIKGAVTVNCSNRSMVIRQGDLCYLYPRQLHEVAPAKAGRGEACGPETAEDGSCAEAEYAVIKFNLHTMHIPPACLPGLYDLFLGRTAKDSSGIVVLGEDLQGMHIAELVDHTVKEYSEKREFYSLQIQANLYTLLTMLARKAPKSSPPARKRQTGEGFSFGHILEYIDAHSGEALEVQELAQICHMSYSHFAKLFRESYGCSCKEYITLIRLGKAQDLLLHTDYDLSYIAQETGFFDCSHFIRTYRKWRGITPKQERLKTLTG